MTLLKRFSFISFFFLLYIIRISYLIDKNRKFPETLTHAIRENKMSCKKIDYISLYLTPTA